jgi:hypothetical protein
MKTCHRSNENGIAMIIALFMMLALSVIGATLITLSTTETNSSFNYRQMSQGRYGGESGIHEAVNYLLNTYVPPTKAVLDAGTYDLTKSPVQWNNKAVVLSSVAANSNYPDAATIAAFAGISTGNLNMKDASVTYSTVATLRSMRSFTAAYSNKDVTIQTWEISGSGSIVGPRTALVEVSSVLERQPVPVYGYAAFATADDCKAMDFAGGALTNSYDSSNMTFDAKGDPNTDKTWGNVGTNGNLTEVGKQTDIHGSLSTPRKGVGACTAGNVTGLTQGGGATVDKGMNPLPQEIKYPDPEPINPVPPLDAQKFQANKTCAQIGTMPFCTNSASGDGHTITPTVTNPPGQTEVYLGNVTLNAGEVLHLHAGIYNVNSFLENGGAQIYVDDGPVVINVEGSDGSGGELANPITIVGNGIVNNSFVSTDLQIVYGGTGEVKMAGGEKNAALVYAPNASADLKGGGDLYGAIIVKTLVDSGGAAIHYDRHLKTLMFMPGDYTMSAFTWKVSNTNTN